MLREILYAVARGSGGVSPRASARRGERQKPAARFAGDRKGKSPGAGRMSPETVRTRRANTCMVSASAGPPGQKENALENLEKNLPKRIKMLREIFYAVARGSGGVSPRASARRGERQKPAARFAGTKKGISRGRPDVAGDRPGSFGKLCRFYQRELSLTVPPERASVSLCSERRAGTGSAGCPARSAMR